MLTYYVRRMAAKTDHRVRLTKSVVDKMAPGETLWDADVRGFGVRCQRRARNYVLKTRVNGRQRWFTIGEHGSPWTPDTARKQFDLAMSVLLDAPETAPDRPMLKFVQWQIGNRFQWPRQRVGEHPE